MPQSLANVLVHIVFSTKERRAFFQNPDLRDEMHRYLAGISANLDCHATIVGGATDHVHLLAAQSRTIALADWVKELKRASSVWAKTRSRQWDLFQWQAGYGAFSVSQSQKARVQEYIGSQIEHHRRLSFQDELRELLKNTKSHLMNNICGIESKRSTLRNPFGVNAATSNRSTLRNPSGLMLRQSDPVFGVVRRNFSTIQSSRAPLFCLILDAVRRELSWTHYRLLLRVETPDARSFYQNEAVNASRNPIA